MTSPGKEQWKSAELSPPKSNQTGALTVSGVVRPSGIEEKRGLNLRPKPLSGLAKKKRRKDIPN